MQANSKYGDYGGCLTVALIVKRFRDEWVENPASLDAILAREDRERVRDAAREIDVTSSVERALLESVLVLITQILPEQKTGSMQEAGNPPGIRTLDAEERAGLAGQLANVLLDDWGASAQLVGKTAENHPAYAAMCDEDRKDWSEQVKLDLCAEWEPVARDLKIWERRYPSRILEKNYFAGFNKLSEYDKQERAVNAIRRVVEWECVDDGKRERIVIVGRACHRLRRMLGGLDAVSRPRDNGELEQALGDPAKFERFAREDKRESKRHNILTFLPLYHACGKLVAIPHGEVDAARVRLVLEDPRTWELERQTYRKTLAELEEESERVKTSEAKRLADFVMTFKRMEIGEHKRAAGERIARELKTIHEEKAAVRGQLKTAFERAARIAEKVRK